MTRQLLRNAKVVIEYKGRAYWFSALSSFSTSTSLGEVTKRRKTLFSNTTRQHSTTSRVNSTATSLNVYLTDNALEKLFLELVGLDSTTDANKTYLPDAVTTATKLFSLYIINEDSVAYSKYNFVESVDISMDKQSPIGMSISINSANLTESTLMQENLPTLNQGVILAPTPVLFNLGHSVVNTITSATISVQQTADWVDSKNLFSVGSPYTFTSATTSDLIVSATIQTNFDTDFSIYNIATNQDIDLAKSGFGLKTKNARIVHNLDIQSVYTNRLDVSITEDTGDTYFYFGE